MMVPSAWETRKRVDEEGTQRTAVHGEFEMEPLTFVSVWQRGYELKKIMPHLLVKSAVARSNWI